jgi:hypothetical protein
MDSNTGKLRFMVTRAFIALLIGVHDFIRSDFENYYYTGCLGSGKSYNVIALKQALPLTVENVGNEDGSRRRPVIVYIPSCEFLEADETLRSFQLALHAVCCHDAELFARITGAKSFVVLNSILRSASCSWLFILDHCDYQDYSLLMRIQNILLSGIKKILVFTETTKLERCQGSPFNPFDSEIQCVLMAGLDTYEWECWKRMENWDTLTKREEEHLSSKFGRIPLLLRELAEMKHSLNGRDGHKFKFETIEFRHLPSHEEYIAVMEEFFHSHVRMAAEVLSASPTATDDGSHSERSSARQPDFLYVLGKLLRGEDIENYEKGVVDYMFFVPIEKGGRLALRPLAQFVVDIYVTLIEKGLLRQQIRAALGMPI